MLELVKCNIADMIARLGGLFCNDKQVLGMILITRDVQFDPATFTKTAFDEVVQKDKVIGTIKIQGGEDANVDASFTDLQSGERIQNNQGLKRWNFTFYKGGRWQNELQKLNESENYAVIFVFDDDSILVQQLKNGKVKGFDVNLFVGIRNVKFGAEGGGTTLMVDLTKAAMSYWQGSSAIYKSSEIDFMEIQPIAELSLKVPVLTAGQTTTVIEITEAGGNTPVPGLTTAANWKLVRNGAKENITTLTGQNGTYTFTHAALTAGQEVYFMTEVAGYPIYVLAQGYFVGKSTPKTVA